MQRNILKTTLLCCLGMLLFPACDREPMYSNVPQIEYRGVDIITIPASNEVQYEQQQIRINSWVTDGDGDLGLSDADTLPPYHEKGEHYLNFILEVFYKTPSGEFEPLPLAFSYSGRYPVLSPTPGKVGPLEVDLKYNGFIFPKGLYDGQTLKFRYFIYDRALNKSNVVETEEISL